MKSVRGASSIKIIIIINCTIIHYTHKQVSLGLHIFLLLSIRCHGLVFELEKAAKHYSLTRATIGLENLTRTQTNKTEWSVPSATPDSFFLIKGSYLYLLLLLPEKLLFVYFRLCIFPLDLLLWLLLLLFWIFSFLVLVLLVFKDHL